MFRALPTFRSLPQAIGLPFLSSHEDAQLAFKAGDNGLKRLSGDDVIPLSDETYWSQYWTLFNSASDVYSLLSAPDIRQALSSNPTNVANLVHSLSYHLFTLLPSTSFPSAPGTSTSAAPTGGAGGDAGASREALNCLRVLGRVLVVVYESEADGAAGVPGTSASWASEYLWSRGVAPTPLPPADTESVGDSGANGDIVGDGGQFAITGDSDSENDAGEEDGLVDEGARAFKAAVGKAPAAQPKPTTPTETPIATSDPLHDPLANPAPAPPADAEDDADTLPSLADRLFSCTIDLLFCAGFTVPATVRGEDGLGDKINYVIWEKGVGSTVSVGSTSELDRNKVEVLRFLIILVSTTIYTSPAALSTASNPPLEHLTHALERRLVLSLLCSLLNTSLASPKSGATSAVPYNHLVFKASDERRTLVRACLMTLLVALDYRSFDTVPSIPGTPGAAPEVKDENAFRYFISKLHRKDDFAFVLGGILGILAEHAAVNNNYLPGSKRPVPYVLETFMLLWRLVDLNKRFRSYLFESGKAIDVIGYTLICCLEAKDDPAHHGLLRLLSYLLQTLSADAGFAQAINQPIRQTVPAKWAVQGSAADFMIVSIYSIATTPGLNPLFPALTIAIANVAPHLRHVGVQASTRLLQLFKAFSAPNFLLADEGHPRLVYYLLETFNSILYHQLNENPNLVYAILRSHQDFQTLATFTLVSGLREIQRRKALRAAAAEERVLPPRGLVRTDSELAMLAEKAALLGREVEDGDDASLSTEPVPISDAIASEVEQTTVVTADQDSPSADITALVSPTSEMPPTVSAPSHTMSEKARGKMRATESTTSLPLPSDGDAPELDMPDEELMKVAAAGVGPNGYVPTQEWVSSWQKGLPLDPVLVAISELLPRIQDSQPPRAGGPSPKVFNLLKGAELAAVLPPAPPILPRKFQWSPQSCVWLTSLLWGDIYVAGLTSVGVWRDTTVRLFGVKQAPLKGRSAQVDRVLKMIGVV